jgi:hypothetical protein
MPGRYWKQTHGNTIDTRTSGQKNSHGNSKHKDEMRPALKDEETLKRKIKRLTIDWFFRPGGD